MNRDPQAESYYLANPFLPTGQFLAPKLIILIKYV